MNAGRPKLCVKCPHYRGKTNTSIYCLKQSSFKNYHEMSNYYKSNCCDEFAGCGIYIKKAEEDARIKRYEDKLNQRNRQDGFTGWIDTMLIRWGVM